MILSQVKMKDSIIIINSYISSRERLLILQNYIEQLNKLNIDILLMCKTSMNVDVECTYKIIDTINPILPNNGTCIWVDNPIFNVKIYQQNHMLSICRSISSSLKFCKLNNYKYFFYTEFDNVISDCDLSKIEDLLRQVNENKSDLIFFKKINCYKNYKNEFLRTNLFFGNISCFLKNIRLPMTIDEWNITYPFNTYLDPFEDYIARILDTSIDVNIQYITDDFNVYFSKDTVIDKFTVIDADVYRLLHGVPHPYLYIHKVKHARYRLDINNEIIFNEIKIDGSIFVHELSNLKDENTIILYENDSIIYSREFNIQDITNLKEIGEVIVK